MGNRSGTLRDLDGRAIPFYPVSQTTYGEPDGIWGINCHHKPPNVFVPGVSQIRGTVPDKAGNDSRYALSQQQRRLEREVRYAKRDAAMMDAAGDKEGFEQAALRAKKAQSELKAFAGANGLPVYSDRARVLGYNKSVAGKATASVRAQEATAKAAKVAADDAKAAKIASIRDTIRSEETQKKINVGNQNKHILGSPGYIDGRSYIYGDLQAAQALVDQYHGMGDIKLTRKGEWVKKEVIAHDSNIGVNVNPDTGEKTPTNCATIHYGKNGTHIVPTKRGVEK